MSAPPATASANKRAVFFLIALSLSVCLFLAIVELGARAMQKGDGVEDLIQGIPAGAPLALRLRKLEEELSFTQGLQWS